jgi:hypothetical protein
LVVETPKPTYLPPDTTRPTPTTTTTRKPKCSNGAPDSAYPDCCKNPGEKGKYCCTNGANNPQCEIPTTPAPKKPEVKSGYDYPK